MMNDRLPRQLAGRTSQSILMEGPDLGTIRTVRASRIDRLRMLPASASHLHSSTEPAPSEFDADRHALRYRGVTRGGDGSFHAVLTGSKNSPCAKLAYTEQTRS